MRISLRPIFVLSLALVACAGDDGTDPTDVTTDEVSYDDVAAIMDTHCTSCHGDTPSNGAPISLSSYDDASGSVDRIIARAIDGDPSPMPPGGLALSDDDEETLQAWKDAGAPE